MSYTLPGVVELLTSRMGLATETVIANFVTVEHNDINKKMGNTIVDNNYKPSKCNIDFALALIDDDTRSRDEHTKLAQVMNSLDVTLLCMSNTYSFTLFEKMNKLFGRCSNRLEFAGNGILKKKNESNHGFRVMRDFLVDESLNDKKTWLNTNAVYLSCSFDANTTRKEPVITTVIKLSFVLDL